MKRAWVWTSIAVLGAWLLRGQSAPAIQKFGGLSLGSLPEYITVGPDGNLWFTEAGKPGSAKIGRITTGGAVTEFPVPTADSLPQGITAGPDGALWFAEQAANKIGRITTRAIIREFSLPSAPTGGGPHGIAAGPDGAIWFTTGVDNKIGRITTEGVVSEFPLPSSFFQPLEITAGPDGALWFTDLADAGKIGRITISGAITQFLIPTIGSFPHGITVGPDRALWFSEDAKIGRITTSGAITEFPLPSASRPYGIATGSDGALWFVENGSGKMGRITTSGVVTEFPIPTPGSSPFGVTAGPDGALWFTESESPKIGRTVPASPSITVQYTITTVAGNGDPDFPLVNNGPATEGALVPMGVAVDRFGNLLVIDRGSATGQRASTVRLVDTAGTITTLACDGPDPLGTSPWGPVLPVHQALCGDLTGVGVDSSGIVYITQGGGRTLDWLESGLISILSFDVNTPQNVAVDRAGNVYVADLGNCRIVRTNLSTAISIVAGETGTCGYSGDNGPATSALLDFPRGVAVDDAGNVYIADSANARVRKVDTSGIITTVAGGSCTSYGAGDGGPATAASLCYPSGVAVDAAGSLFIAEDNAGLIRRVDTAGIITTVAGSQTTVLGDGGPATSASLAFPYSVAVGPAGKLYIGDSGHSRVRLLTPMGPTVVANVRVTSTGFVYSRVTRTYNGTITVTNTSAAAITGPLQLVLTHLSAVVILLNETGLDNGNPFMTIPSVTSLGPGQSVSLNVQFQDPSNTLITFTPVLYSGTF